ncbi:phage tail tape measure protein [Pseudomonas nitroreducens]|uniref:phage tail tape measure protein n=1 Tax=Pseudomonas TaxID=286 RepID=UPI0007EE7527|nr:MULTISPECIES: phage tail tape measure protein [Pseudomonas]MDG9856341.1 phage tail tape measure protein [Pseudomonas nitroreducens]MDH1073709.1 phage tail tape measure protein [Pseudomonas nitroreducens]NMZ71639.1 phage tail tape measure protein [Pseudomonas nitroreducens]OBY55815.1 phage tail tape measure protein [Pseudomonas sp. AU12215]UCL86703.1 phage tail tape measure protein [Pseudomonas sp. HS-18]
MASKSLGVLTLDLVAKVSGFVQGMDAAERSSAKWRKEVEKNAKAAGVAIGAGIAAGVTALGAITVGAINSAKEISNLSSVANTSTTEFQKYAAGAKVVGIEQEKLADIFKDVNDKVGDFLNTGGGALADFFTNIAPKVGVTADDFRNLSGPQALGLYVHSLEKANVSQADMTFYMEAIASDATSLLPLLRNNSEGFTMLGDAAEAAGAIMDEKTIKSANELKAATWLIEQSTAGLKNQLVSQLLPVLSDFADDLFGVSKQGTVMVTVGETVVTTIKWMAKAAVGAVGAFDLMGKAIGGAAAVAASGFKDADWTDLAMGPAALGVRLAKNWDGIKSTAEGVGEDLRAETLKWAGYIENIDKAGTGGTNGFVKQIAGVMDELNKLSNKPGTFRATTQEEQAAAKAAEQAAKALQKRFDDAETGYERQIALINTEVDKRKDATEVAKLQFEIESGKLKGINAQQQERLNGLAAELDRLQKLKKANEDAAKAAAFGSNLDQENSTAAAGLDIDLAGAGMGEKYRSRLQEMLQIKQTYNEKLADLNEQYNSGEITKELYDEENEIIQAAMEKRLKIQEGYYERADEAQADWMKGVDEAFQNYVDSAENHYQIAADAITGILGGATSALSDSIYDVFTGTETLSDSLGNLAVTIGQTIVKAIADMAAQWLVAQAIQLVFGRTTQMSAAATMAANAQATSLQAGLAAFASTAAIPIVGPALAPGAMAAALAITEPVAIAVGTSALAGMAHDGIDKVPVSGTWNLEKGERVTTAETSAKLDRTLERVQAGMANGGGRNSSITNNFYQTTTDARSQQAANAKAARQIARIVNNSERYT